MIPADLETLDAGGIDLDGDLLSYHGLANDGGAVKGGHDRSLIYHVIRSFFGLDDAGVDDIFGGRFKAFEVHPAVFVGLNGLGPVGLFALLSDDVFLALSSEDVYFLRSPHGDVGLRAGVDELVDKFDEFRQICLIFSPVSLCRSDEKIVFGCRRLIFVSEYGRRDEAEAHDQRDHESQKSFCFHKSCLLSSFVAVSV